MLYLTFLVCLARAPDADPACNVTKPSERNNYPTVEVCQHAGMMLAPQWTQAHPGWTVKKIRCGPEEDNT